MNFSKQSDQSRPSASLTFTDWALLEQALTHRSYTNEHSGKDNQRLEFLGDAILNAAVAQLVYERNENNEGQLTKVRSSLVSNENLVKLALHLGLERLLRVGGSLRPLDPNRNPKVLADAFEAVVGAYYLDQGWEATVHFLETLLFSRNQSSSSVTIHPKTALQEWAQSKGFGIPEYTPRVRLPDAQPPYFQVAVTLLGIERGLGEGQNIRDAERDAAEQALASLTGSTWRHHTT